MFPIQSALSVSNYHKYKNCCKYYEGRFPLETRRKFILSGIDCTEQCNYCHSSPCVWKTMGDVMIDPVIIGLEDDKVYELQILYVFPECMVRTRKL